MIIRLHTVTGEVLVRSVTHGAPTQQNEHRREPARHRYGCARPAPRSLPRSESRFLDVGNHLADAIVTIEELTTTFDRLNGALRGNTLHQATQCLTGVMTEIAAMAHMPDGTGPALQRLQRPGSAISRSMSPIIAKSVHGISILAINARIEAVTIGSAGDDFISFTAEISRTIDIATRSAE